MSSLVTERPLLLAGLGIAAVSISAFLALRSFEGRLRRKIARNYSTLGPYDRAFQPSELPESASSASAKVFADEFELSLPTAWLAVPRADALLSVLRTGMSGFANLPQGTAFRFLMRGKQNTGAMNFADIMALAFNPGDKILGVFKVLRREPGFCEISLSDSALGGHTESVMVYQVLEEDDKLVVRTGTVMWDRDDLRRGDIPMARGFNRWLHEITAMWLLEKCVDGLQRNK